MRLKSFFISVGLIASFLVGPISINSANSLQIKVAPAKWGHIYASGKTASIQSTPRPISANLEKKSRFVINFNNVPENVKIPIQAAVDVWSENFSSTVPINININWGRSTSYSVLASASAKKNFANFIGAPDKTL